MRFVWSSGPKRGLAAPPSFRAPRGRDTRACLIATAGGAYAPWASFAGCRAHCARASTGEGPPVASAALCFAAPLLDLRPKPGSSRSLRPGRAPMRNAWSRDPPDLDAGSPVTSRSVRSGLPAGLPLLGLSKDRPSIVSSRGVRRRGGASPRRPSGAGCLPLRVPSTWFSTTSTVCSSSTAQVCFTLLPILGFAVFPLRHETELPHDAFLPSEAFPPPTATNAALTAPAWGKRHGSTISGLAFTAPLAPSPLAPRR